MLHVKLVSSTRFLQGNARNYRDITYIFQKLFPTIVCHQGHKHHTQAHIPYNICGPIAGLSQVKLFGCTDLFASSCLFFYILSLIFSHIPQQLLMDKRVGLKRYELNGRKVLFYFDEVS